MPHLPPVAQAIAVILGVALAIFRLLTASKAFWSVLPNKLQKAIPALLVAVGLLPTALENAKSWLDVATALTLVVGAYFTASRGDQSPPKDSDGGPRLKRSNTDPKTDDVSLIPEPMKLSVPDRSRLHNDAPDEPAEMSGKWRHWDWRLQLVFGVLLACVLSCAAEKRLPCDEAKLQAVDAAYLVEVGKHCLKYATAAECPELPDLRAKHSRDLKAVCP